MKHYVVVSCTFTISCNGTITSTHNFNIQTTDRAQRTSAGPRNVSTDETTPRGRCNVYLFVRQHPREYNKRNETRTKMRHLRWERRILNANLLVHICKLMTRSTDRSQTLAKKETGKTNLTSK